MLIKKIFFLLLSLILFVLISNSSPRAQETPNQNDDNNTPVVDSIDYNENLLDSNEAYKQQFDSLSKDGEWIKAKKADFVRDVSANTGEDLEQYYPQTAEVIYIWRPYCSNEYWNPYSNGRWVFSYNGWMWLSNYNWGWGPYNYGRWFCSNAYGWIWLPGRVWASNWVTWRYHGHHIGWYPICPKVRWIGYYSHKVYTNHVFASIPKNWVFINKNDFTKEIDNNTIVSIDNNAKILKYSQKVKTAIYVDPGMPKFKYNGPDVNDISKETGEKIQPKQVAVTNSKDKQYVDDNNISTYKKSDSSPLKDYNSKTNTKDTGYKKTTKEDNNYSSKPGDKKTSTGPGTKKVRDKQDEGSKYNEGSEGSDGDKTKEGSKGSKESNDSKDDETKGSRNSDSKK